MGADQFERFDTWREWERIPELAHIAVARRAAAPPHLNPVLQKLRDSRYLKYPGTWPRARPGRWSISR